MTDVNILKLLELEMSSLSPKQYRAADPINNLCDLILYLLLRGTLTPIQIIC